MERRQWQSTVRFVCPHRRRAKVDGTHHQWPVIAFLRLGQVFQDAEHTVELLLLLRDLAGNLFELLLLTQKLLLHRLSLHRPKKEKNWNQHSAI